MAENNENADSTTMKVTVKTPKEQHVIEINSTAGVKEVRMVNTDGLN